MAVSIDVLPGFREFYPKECFYRNFLFQRVREVCNAFCFAEYDSPILEPVELYTEKSGDEIVSQLFNFSDHGGRNVAMRPEITPAVARMIGSKIHTLKRPLKWFSIEENFRYERPQKGRLRSFYQFNIDIFDEPGVVAEAEVISLAVTILRAFGLTERDFYVRLSDRTLWAFFLQIFGIRDEQIPDVLSIVDKIEREPRESLEDKLRALGLAEAADLLEQIIRLQAIRDIDTLRAFFANTVVSLELRSAIEERIAQLENLLKRLNEFGLREFIELDFNIVRGLAYYTGFVFEFFERTGKSRAIAGGGRYDNLIEKFGYPKTSAVGLAIGDVTLLNVLTEKQLLPEYEMRCEVFIIFDEMSRKIAMQDIMKLRAEGVATDYALREQSIDKQFKQASLAHWVIRYESTMEQISIRNVQERKEIFIERSQLLDFFREHLK